MSLREVHTLKPGACVRFPSDRKDRVLIAISETEDGTYRLEFLDGEHRVLVGDQQVRTRG